MYKVILWFSFGAMYATEEEEFGGKVKVFETLEEAESYGRHKTVPFETILIKE